MKIAFVGNFSEIYHEEGKALSLQRSGHEVIRFYEPDFNLPGDFLMNHHSIFACNPDVIIYAKFHAFASAKTMLVARDKNIPTVSWMPDLFFGLEREKLITNNSLRLDYIKNIQDMDDPNDPPIFDSTYVFSPDGGNDDKFKQHNVNHSLVRQAIYDKCCYKGKPQEKIRYDGKEYKPDILFVGGKSGVHQYRTEMINWMKETYGDRFLHVGWKSDEDFRMDDLNNLIATCKIVIGESVYSPYYWSNRLYETIGRGGFMIHPFVEGIDKEYKDGDHFITYKSGDFKDLYDKMEYFLKNDIQRQKIADEGMKYTMENHTLMNRAKQVMDIIS